MRRYKVAVGFTNDRCLPTFCVITVQAKNKKEAQEIARAKLWDTRLDTTDCKTVYVTERL